MGNLIIISKEDFDFLINSLIEIQNICEPYEVEYFLIYKEYSGIIFYIKEENKYGAEMIWENGKKMLVTFSAYVEFLNQISSELEKSFQEFEQYFKELFI